jgi:hypothetical protein
MIVSSHSAWTVYAGECQFHPRTSGVAFAFGVQCFVTGMGQPIGIAARIGFRCRIDSVGHRAFLRRSTAKQRGKARIARELTPRAHDL